MTTLNGLLHQHYHDQNPPTYLVEQVVGYVRQTESVSSETASFINQLLQVSSSILRIKGNGLNEDDLDTLIFFATEAIRKGENEISQGLINPETSLYNCIIHIYTQRGDFAYCKSSQTNFRLEESMLMWYNDKITAAAMIGDTNEKYAAYQYASAGDAAYRLVAVMKTQRDKKEWAKKAIKAYNEFKGYQLKLGGTQIDNERLEMIKRRKGSMNNVVKGRNAKKKYYRKGLRDHRINRMRPWESMFSKIIAEYSKIY